MDNKNKNNRTKINRGKNHSVDDKSSIYQIIDEGLICHIAFIRDGYPVVLPTNYARDNDNIIIHGSQKSPFYLAMKLAESICLSITLLDGLVLAKSAFNHSVNYRSVIIFGKAVEITDKPEKIYNLKKIIDHVIPNRWEGLRAPSERELDETMLLSIPIIEYSAKCRAGQPTVSTSDECMNIWSGVLPLSLKAGVPIGDTFSTNSLPAIELQQYNREQIIGK